MEGGIPAAVDGGGVDQRSLARSHHHGRPTRIFQQSSRFLGTVGGGFFTKDLGSNTVDEKKRVTNWRLFIECRFPRPQCLYSAMLACSATVALHVQVLGAYSVPGFPVR